jgi:hypothetical protein
MDQYFSILQYYSNRPAQSQQSQIDLKCPSENFDKRYLANVWLKIMVSLIKVMSKVQLGKREDWVSGKFRFYSAL